MRQLRTLSTTRSPSMAWLTTTCTAVLAAVQVACGSPTTGTDTETWATPSASATEAQVPTLEEPACNDVIHPQGSAQCAAGFVVNDISYGLSCDAVRPEVVTEQVVARGKLSGTPVEVRSVEGVRPEVLVAVSIDGGVCDDVVSPWSMAFPYGAPQAEVNEAICAVVFPEHRERNNCA